MMMNSILFVIVAACVVVLATAFDFQAQEVDTAIASEAGAGGRAARLKRMAIANLCASVCTLHVPNDPDRDVQLGFQNKAEMEKKCKEMTRFSKCVADCGTLTGRFAKVIKALQTTAAICKFAPEAWDSYFTCSAQGSSLSATYRNEVMQKKREALQKRNKAMDVNVQVEALGDSCDIVKSAAKYETELAKRNCGAGAPAVRLIDSLRNVQLSFYQTLISENAVDDGRCDA